MADELTDELMNAGKSVAVQTGQGILGSMVSMVTSLAFPLILIGAPLLFTDFGQKMLQSILPPEWYDTVMQYRDKMVAWMDSTEMGHNYLTPILKWLGIDVDKITDNVMQGMEPDERYNAILDKTGSTELANAVKQDNGLWQDILAARKASNGQIDAQFLLTLLSKHPDVMGNVIKEMANKPSDQQNPQIQQAIQTLLTDPATMKQLMANDKSKAMLVDAVEAFSPVKFKDKALGNFVLSQAFDDQGNLRPEFKDVLGSVLNGQGQNLLQSGALFKMLQSSSPAAIAQLMAKADVSDEQTKGLVSMLSTEASAKAFQDYTKTIGADKATQLFTLLANKDTNGAIIYLTDKNNGPMADATVTFLRTLDKSTLPAGVSGLVDALPLFNNQVTRDSLNVLATNGVLDPLAKSFNLTDGKPSLNASALIQVMQTNGSTFENPDVRRAMGNLLKGYSSIDGTSQDSLMTSFLATKNNDYPMLKSAIELTRNIDPKTDPVVTDKIVNGLLALPKEGKLEGVSASDFTTFFNSPSNRNALGSFLRNIDENAFDDKYKPIAKALRVNSSALTDVLNDSAGADFMGKLLSDPKSTIASTVMAKEGLIDGGKKIGLVVAGDAKATQDVLKIYLDTGPKIVQDNRAAFAELLSSVMSVETGKDIKVASLETDPAIAKLVAQSGAKLANVTGGVSVASNDPALVTGRNDSVMGLGATA